MKLIDSHIHLDFNAFDKDRGVLINQARSAGISRFVVPATTRKSWPSIESLAQNYPDIAVAYGIHPYFIGAHTLEDCDALNTWLEAHSCAAVGEIGLDYFIKELDPLKQLSLFKAQLDIAREHRLPVILHARGALDEVILQLKMHGLERGIVHSFNGSYVQAMRLIQAGFKLGFGGALTYSRATRLQALVKRLPLEAICIETDAPDQPASGFLGKRNEPLALLEVLATIALLHNTSAEIIAQHSTENTLSALNIC